MKSLHMLNVIIGLFATMVLVMGYGAGLIGYSYRGYTQAKQQGKPPMVDALVHAILGFFITSGIVFVLLGSLEVLGFPVKTYIKAFASGSAKIIYKGFGLTPYDLAAAAATHMSCIFAFTMHIIVTLVPILLIVGAFVGFYISREQKQRAGVYDDIMDSTFMSVMLTLLVAFIVRMTYDVLDYWGVPVYKFIDDIFGAKASTVLFPDVVIPACRAPLADTLSALINATAFFTKAAIVLSVLMVFLLSTYKKIMEIRQQHQQKPMGAFEQGLKIFLHFMGLAMIIPPLAWAILRIVEIRWDNLATWFGVWL